MKLKLYTLSRNEDEDAYGITATSKAQALEIANNIVYSLHWDHWLEVGLSIEQAGNLVEMLDYKLEEEGV